MNSADLITSFFNNELSPDQERQFLLSVASSDSMRLGLKSHVMLDRILQEENQESDIAPGTRRTILREAAAVAALAAGGSQQAAAAEGPVTSAPSTTGGFPAWGATILSLLVAAGSFFAGFYVGESSDESAVAEQSTPLPQVEMIAEPAPGFASPEKIALFSVRTIADELVPVADVEVDAEPVAAAAVETRPLASSTNPSTPLASSSQGDGEEADAATDNSGEASGGSGSGSPNAINSGPTSIKKPNEKK